MLLCLLLLDFQHTGAQPVPVPVKDSAEELTDTSGSVMQVSKAELAKVAQPTSRPDSLIQYAYTFLGSRYRRGGTTTKGFDCSGFTLTVFKELKIKLPHTSAGQGLMGVQVSRENIKKGDLVFFRSRNRRSRRIGHVGIVISEKGDPVRFIHSSTSEGVRIDRLDYLYYKRRFVKAVRIPDLYR